MACFDKKEGVRQTHWAPPGVAKGQDRWYANLSPEVDDLQAIEQAKTIVDVVMPQRLSTQYGGHFYSFVNREFLLNQLLYFWKDTGTFPSGWICLVDESTMRPVGNDSGWWAFNSRKDGRVYAKPRWLHIPTYEGAVAFIEEKARKAKEAEEAAQRTAHIPRRSYGFWARWGKD